MLATAQELEKYTSYTRYLMNSDKSTEQAIYDNILERAFSMDLSSDAFYKEVNSQSRYALIVKMLYYLDEAEAKGADHGIFMMLFTSALREGSEKKLDMIQFTTTSFSTHYNWFTVLKSYTLSSGTVRGNIGLREKYNLK